MRVVRLILKILYLWFWVIPIQFGMLAFICYFGLIYLLYGTISVSEIKMFLGKNDTTFFICYWLPFAVPMLLSLGAIFGSSLGSKSKSLEDAIIFRNGQMSKSSDKDASEILKKTTYLDMLQKNDSDVFEKARRGFDATYGASSPTKAFRDLMDDNDA